VKAREYTGPLGILAAGAIGISLLCSVSSMAMGDLSRYVPITLEPLNFVDLAVANFQTVAALTEQVVTAFVPTETLVPTGTDSPASLTPQPTETQRRFVTITPTLPRRTRIPSSTAVIIASRTPTPRPPTRTPTSIPPTVTRTSTPVPPTDTPIPPTDTLQPDTDTPQPDTNTPQPDTDTPPPPQDTDTPLPLDQPPTSANPVFVPSPTPGP
jgi:hypothetical protein